MDKFDKHIIRNKTITLTAEDGTEDEFIIQPITDFKYILPIYRLVKKLTELVAEKELTLNDLEDETKQKDIMQTFMKLIDDKTLQDMYDVTTATLKESYPDKYKTEEDRRKMDMFAKHNMLALFEPIVELNAGMGGMNQSDIERKIKTIKKIEDENNTSKTKTA